MTTRDIGPLKPRVDLVPGDFDRLIREKGYRVLWASAELCPCRLNDITDQADPSCAYCDGTGYFYTFPDPNEPDLIEYTKEDPPFESTTSERATQAIITSMAKEPLDFEKLGDWVSGTASLTTFSWNRIGHRDRFKIVDHTIVYRQVLIVPDGQTFSAGKFGRATLRYPIVKLRRAFEIPTSGSPIDHTAGCTVEDDGSLVVPADVGARLSISYEMNPVWVVTNHPNIVRGSLIKQKTKKVLGNNEVLPIRCLVKLDFLVDKTNALE